jgi:hypothetical protein
VVALLTIDLDEDFIDVERVAVASMFSFQSTGIYGTKLDTPETNRFCADTGSSFIEEIFDVAVAQVESIVEPNIIGNNVRWESVSLISSHVLIISKSGT